MHQDAMYASIIVHHNGPMSQAEAAAPVLNTRAVMQHPACLESLLACLSDIKLSSS